MKRIIFTARLLVAAVATTAALGFATLAEAATVTYDYVGNHFTDISATNPLGGGTPPLSDSMSLGSSINASVTFDAAFVTSSFTGIVSLDQNASYFLGYSISTVGGTYANGAAGILKNLSITFTNGLITSWNLQVAANAGPVGLPVTWKTQFIPGPPISMSLYQVDEINGTLPSAWKIDRSVISNPGTWTRGVVEGAPVSAVPLPAALPLFGAAIAGMGLLRTRKRRKMSAAIA